MIRSIIKAYLPAYAVERVRRNRLYLSVMNQKARLEGHGPRAFFRYALAAESNRRRFEKINLSLPAERISFAPDVSFNTCAEAREVHEWFGYRDGESVEEMQSFIRHTRDKKCLLDIGALFGTFSLTFASHGGRVYAIEPSAEPFAILHKNIRLNPAFQITAHQLAFSDENGSMLMRPEWKHLVATQERTSDSLEVRRVTLDDFVNEQGIAPDALKIDVEGHELAVLRGGLAYIRSRKPLIFLEVDNWHAPQSTQEIVQLLHSLGYGFLHALNRPIRSPERYLSWGIRRVVCTPE